MERLTHPVYFWYIMLGLVVLFPAVVRVIAIILTKRWASPKLGRAPLWAHTRSKVLRRGLSESSSDYKKAA